MMKVEVEREDDGRWIAEIEKVPGAIALEQTGQVAIAKVQALVLRVLANRLDHGDLTPDVGAVFAVAP